ncbi:MAG: radical SAM family heme chaperone HemW [Deltaproteobacteria bacterium]|nr:radical SAM family heme chaperone HemW [Deltaproteobacteria bacterium]
MSPGLYVHVPFCRSKCPYCGFYSIPSAAPVPIWFEGIKKEVLLYKSRFNRFDSLYLGGGTPTFLNDRVFSGLVDHLFTHFDFAGDTEFTVEANPSDLSEKKVRLLKDLGCNRINLGIQSFDDRALAFLGRRHTAEDAKGALARLRRFGFHNVGVDLIYGLPGQSVDAWTNTLKCALSYAPEHVSCYELTIEKGTVFDRLKQKGVIRPMNEEDGRACFVAASKLLRAAGYIHYEVSNYAGSEACCSRHNRKYWQHVPYLGLGPSAHSFDGNDRWWNIRSVRGYGAELDKGKPPIEGRETLTEEQMRLESLALGFRTREGVDLRQILSVPDSGALLSRMEKGGYVKVREGRVIPTEEGFLLADHLPLSLFA